MALYRTFAPLVALLASGAVNAAGAAHTDAHTDAHTYYVAPTGSDTASGTEAAPWRSIAQAQARVAPGDFVYFRGGTYTYSSAIKGCASRTDSVSAITLDKSGSPDQPIHYWAYPGELPVFDFSSMQDDCRVKGLNVVANWLHVKGLALTGAPQQPGNRLNHESWGIWINGSHNVFEQIDTHHHMGPGLFIKDGSHNLVLNSDSHHNYDPYTSNGAGQSADGFGAHVKANQPGNVFRGCRAWSNSDDGFDLINAYSPVTIEHSWAWLHGYLPGTLEPLVAGNGNGIKAGGYGGRHVSNGVVHTVRFSVAFANKAAGFYANHHPLAIDFFNNTGFANHPDFNMLGIDASGAPVGLGHLRNNVALGPEPLAHLAGADQAFNSWNMAAPVALADADSAATTGWDAPRQPDGSLPLLPALRLAPHSAWIGKGVDVGLPFAGAAPDLGAFARAATAR